MRDLIDRYIYDVVRRVPDKDREELTKELKSNIYDMLPDDPTDDEIKSALYELGRPAKLAEKYQPEPRYLISPSTYGDYIRILKWIMIRGTILITLLNAINIIRRNTIMQIVDVNVLDAPALIMQIVESGFSAAGQILIFTTITFVIIDRVSNKRTSKESDQEWDIDDLPEFVQKDDTGKISRLETLFGIGITAAVLIGILNVYIDFFNLIDMGVFTPEAITAITIVCLVSIAADTLKLIKGRWTPAVCVTTIVYTLISLGSLIYLLMGPGIFTEYFDRFFFDRFLIGNHSIAIMAVIIFYSYGTEIWRAVNYLRR